MPRPWWLPASPLRLVNTFSVINRTWFSIEIQKWQMACIKGSLSLVSVLTRLEEDCTVKRDLGGKENVIPWPPGRKHFLLTCHTVFYLIIWCRLLDILPGDDENRWKCVEICNWKHVVKYSRRILCVKYRLSIWNFLLESLLNV